jgi:alkylglycerol monooxygenase
MERYGQILTIASPVFFGLVLLEKLYGHLKGQDKTPLMDMISSLYSGVTNTVKDILGLSISILTYAWMEQNLAVTHLSPKVWMYVLVFIVLDFQGYWVHRWSHKINFFWNKHAIHHSSEEFNLACALRQSVSSFINLFTFFLLPAALLGVPTIIIGTMVPIHLFAQFWYHTCHIDKMGFLEKIIVTPSHHRVHHALNPEYMDKNYSQIFIIWDRLFGSFQEELPNVPPVYGTTVAAQTWNPLKINFQHLWIMTQDAIYTKDWRDKLRLWGMPTGWRPDDMTQRFPLKKIEDVNNFEKYNPDSSTGLKSWSFLQLLIMLCISMHLYGNIARIGVLGSFSYAFFIIISIYSLTELMDKHRLSWVWEILRCVFGFSLLYTQKGWFGLETIFPNIQYLLGFYFLLSLGMCFLLIKEKISPIFAQNLSHNYEK